LDGIRHLLHDYHALGWPVGLALGIGVPLLSFLVGLTVVVRLPADFFVRPKTQIRSRGLLSFTWFVAKNALGVLVFFAGAVMALPLVPGPGVLFMLVGMALVDFPGKRVIERRLLHERHLLSSVNRVRARFGKVPLITEQPSGMVESRT
jgi:hypothetical protein